ncbi:MAG: Bug family tripartite tricarboxylate transporter substrate binding protein [Reyranella sp.]|uniref:Bug family tripartite tricarboxylate transporter substrate binding protein n=1 Tax=Reyranella sp. TaxID=1929291 RepID=UPI003D12680B
MRLAVALVILVSALAPGPRADAQTAPAPAGDKPLRFVMPYAAGSGGDSLIRLMAEPLRTSLGRPVIVENKPGAAGRVGVQSVKVAPPDGSVLLFVPIAPMSVFPHVYPDLGYDAVADFRPVTQIATFDLGLAVGPAVPAKTVSELVAWLKANSDKASYGTPAAGSLPHFFALMFGRAAGLEMRHVPYKGNAPALADLTGGHLPLFFTSTPDLVELHKAGRLRVLATSGRERSVVLTGIPTFGEAGYAIEGTGWYGIFAPTRTPDGIVNQLSEAIVAASRTQAVVDRMRVLGLRPTGTTPAELGRIQRADLDLWGPVIRESGFKPDQ